MYIGVARTNDVGKSIHISLSEIPIVIYCLDHGELTSPTSSVIFRLPISGKLTHGWCALFSDSARSRFFNWMPFKNRSFYHSKAIISWPYTPKPEPSTLLEFRGHLCILPSHVMQLWQHRLCTIAEAPRKPTTDSETLRPAWFHTSAANSSSTLRCFSSSSAISCKKFIEILQAILPCASY